MIPVAKAFQEVCWVAGLLPTFLLVIGALPFWGRPAAAHIRGHPGLWTADTREMASGPPGSQECARHGPYWRHSSRTILKP